MLGNGAVLGEGRTRKLYCVVESSDGEGNGERGTYARTTLRNSATRPPKRDAKRWSATFLAPLVSAGSGRVTAYASTEELAEQAAEAMLTAEPADSRPFASFSMDAGRYYDLMGDAVMRAETDDGEEPPPEELRSAIRDIMLSSGELYERMAVDVHFTERGIEISSRMTLAD